MRYLLLVLIGFLVFACNEGDNSNANSDRSTLGLLNVYDGDDLYEPEVLQSEKSYNPNGVTSKDVEIVDQKLIKESYLRFETQDLDKTYNQIITFVRQNNGYIQSDNSSKNYNRIYRNLTIRIPTNNFEKTVDSISNYVVFFDEKRVSSKDVTEEFIDLEARLKAKLTLEKRYLDLLSKAKNVGEMLEIEKELSNIREEVEAKQGRLKYLQNRVSLSTLNIEFYKVTSQTGVTVSYGAKMWNAIKSGFNGLSVFFLGLLHIWPLLLILIIAVFWFRRWYFKKRKK